MVWRVSETAVIWARVPDAMHNELVGHARRRDRPVASEVRRALRFYLANYAEADRVLSEMWEDPKVRIATVLDAGSEPVLEAGQPDGRGAELVQLVRAKPLKSSEDQPVP
jgi:hypothetical protein